MAISRSRSTPAASFNTSSASFASCESFTIADCAASPSLYYANKVLPFRDSHRHAAAYLDRLMARPAFTRVLEEAKPYAHMFPAE